MTDNAMRFTDQERDTLRNAAMGAMMLVSKSDPGFLGSIKEMLAGSKALRSSSPEMQEIFKGMSMPKMPKGSQADMESNVIGMLQQSTQILQMKAPQELQDYRNTVMHACDQAAKAQGGTSQNEMNTINKIRSALGA